jgi:K+-sensing histidine kinase KdpD
MIRAEYAIENERIRNLFLTTFSYDVPQKLSSLSKMVSKLLAGEEMGDEEKTKIVKQIRAEVEQLNALSVELHNILKSRSNVVPDEGKTAKS